MSLEEPVGNDTRDQRADDRHHWHPGSQSPDQRWRFVLWVQFQHIVEIQHRQLVGTTAYGSGAHVGNGIKPHQWVREDGLKALGDTDPRASARVNLVMNEARPPGFLRSLFRAESHDDRAHRSDQRWNTE